ncbi:MAG: hypothetical protein NT002_08810 [candidate division Zixibacteria bacterium]|nr:hypothetical protein [candidate division Zixibacteria bacterium]
MILAKNQHIFERQNTAIANTGPKTASHAKQKTGHTAQNRVTSSQLFWAYYLTLRALYSTPTKLHILKNEETNPFCQPSPDHPTPSPATNNSGKCPDWR